MTKDLKINIKNSVLLFYESVYPELSASSIRAKFISLAFKNKFGCAVEVLTGTVSPSPINGVGITSINQPKLFENKNLLFRIFYEVCLGLKASAKIRNRDSSVLYISSPSFIAVAIILIFAICKKTKYILEVRDLYPEAYADAGLISESSLIYLIARKLSIYFYSNAYTVVSLTEGMSTYIRKYTTTKVVTSYNGFPSSLINTDPEKFHRFTICFHGTLGMLQDVNMLTEIAKCLPNDIDMVIIGAGVNKYHFDDIEPTRANIKIYSSMPYGETMNLISKCHLGLSLRKNDRLSQMSFPVKNWEYLGLGIPSLVSPGNSEAALFLSKHNCGIPVGYSVFEIISIIKRLREDPTEYRQLVNSCNFTRGLYTREILSEFLLDNIDLQFIT